MAVAQLGKQVAPPKDEKAGDAAAIESLLTSNRRGLSFVDRTSFALMRRLGLEQVFAFDRLFAEQGFSVASKRT